MYEQSESIHIGTRNGIIWTCHREPCESLQQWERRAEAMRRAFREVTS